MSRGRSMLDWASAGFAALALIGALPGCERTIDDEDFNDPEDGGSTPGPVPTPCDPECDDGSCAPCSD